MKIGIVCCSNGIKEKVNKTIRSMLGKEDIITELSNALNEIGIEPAFSKSIYANEAGHFVAAGSAKERAQELMKFFADKEIKAICDISGGDVANEILDYLDFDLISKSHKYFMGYSDLTVILNAIYARTGKETVLYQIRNIVSDSDKYKNNSTLAKEMFNLFIKSYTLGLTDDYLKLTDLEYEKYYVPKGCNEVIEGVMIGGNIRCFLKLAGTKYMPEFDDKILLLEARSGSTASIITYLSQLKQIGAFDKVKAIILGTFTEHEKNMNLEVDSVSVEKLVLEYTHGLIPIFKTRYIGHDINARVAVIGKKYVLK